MRHALVPIVQLRSSRENRDDKAAFNCAFEKSSEIAKEPIRAEDRPLKESFASSDGYATFDDGKATEIGLLNYTDLPDWMKDNASLRTCYRRQLGSYRSCLLSCLHLHNESINIYTHAFQAVFFCALAAAPFSPSLCSFITYIGYHYVLINPLPTPGSTITYIDTAIVYFFLCSAIYLFTASASFHCFRCHSPGVCHTCSICDHSGIVVLIIGSAVANIYYGYFEQPVLQCSFISAQLLLGGTIVVLVIQPKYRDPAYRRVKTALYFSLFALAFLPALEATLREGAESTKHTFGSYYLALEFFFYSFGALLYVERIPERFSTGFDLVPSHALFHIFINFGALAHLAGLSTAFHHRHGSSYAS